MDGHMEGHRKIDTRSDSEKVGMLKGSLFMFQASAQTHYSLSPLVIQHIQELFQ